jgi:hypothetical protein
VRALASEESLVTDEDSLADVEIDVTEFIEESVVQRRLIGQERKKCFLSSKESKDKKRAAQYSTFWRELVASSGSSLYKLPHMQILTKWLIQLTTHTHRMLRYSAVHVAIEVLGGLVTVGQDLRGKITALRSKITKEEAKKKKTTSKAKGGGKKKKKGKSAILKNATAELVRAESQRAEVRKLLSLLSENLTLRIKDVDDAIRAKVTSAIGKWIPAYVQSTSSSSSFFPSSLLCSPALSSLPARALAPPPHPFSFILPLFFVLIPFLFYYRYPVSFAKGYVLRPLAELLNDSSPTVREATLKALTDIVEGATKSAKDAAAAEDDDDVEGDEDDDDVERESESRRKVLNFISRRNVCVRLQEMLQDPESSVIRAAITGVEKLGHLEAVLRSSVGFVFVLS